MDKYEFNIKVEQIKKMVTKGDFETSMKIADTIDWRRGRSANLLSMISQVYEKNGEYGEAKEVLLLAYERAPVGKRLLYKLTELALKEGSTREAEDYYREFCDLVQDDPRQYLLRYMILKEKKAADDQLIACLERYVGQELDEKWMYELASLYAKAGQQQKCVQMCDRIMLMFGFGKYVDKAMDLKVHFAPLSAYQLDLMQNRDKYEAKLKAVEQEYNEDMISGFDDEPYIAENTKPRDYQEDGYPEGVFPIERYREETYRQEEYQGESIQETYPANEYQQEYFEEGYGNISQEEVPYQYVAEMEPQEMEVPSSEPAFQEPVFEGDEEETEPIDEELVVHLHQADMEQELAREMSKISAKASVEQEPPAMQTKVPYKAQEVDPKPVVEEEPEPLVEQENLMDSIPCYFMVEAKVPDRGFEAATIILKKIHQVSGSNNQVAKITGSRLNQRGIGNLADKLMGRDLVVEEAGDLSKEELLNLKQFVSENTMGTCVILIDNPRQMEELYQQSPELTALFERVDSEEINSMEEEPPVVMERRETEEREEEPVRNEELPISRPVPASPASDEIFEQEMPLPEPEDDEEMDIDEFADYATRYASEIDCSITGKSMLALYERIEIMEEDGIPLTKANAEELIEEAADKAEKPSLGKLITGMFSSKYDKEGLLILREEHFI